MKATQKSKFALVNLVCSLLNLGDFAKVENFVTKTIKVLEKEVKLLERNLQSLKVAHDTALEDITDSIEDLEIDLETAYNNINPEHVSNNKAIKDYMETYLNDISLVEQKIEAAKEKREKAMEAFKDEKENITKEIALRQRRIAKLSSE